MRLRAGATLDAAGNLIDWPGWIKQANGGWVLDPNTPGHDLPGSAVAEVWVNPSTAVTKIYSSATPDCNPNPPKAVPSDLPNRGSEVATTGLLGTAGLLILLGILAMYLVWRRHRRDGAPRVEKDTKTRSGADAPNLKPRSAEAAAGEPLPPDALRPLTPLVGDAEWTRLSTPELGA